VLNINPQYLVDDKGEKTAALLSIKEYRLLMQRLEDLEDMLEMDAAIQTETDFRDYRDIRADLIKD
jgi:PHD/YefM family antitoxin component YafN of YafNO toxin-antitoxin module